MKKNLLYFEEYVSPLSLKLAQREDINVLKIRATKTMTRYFTDVELREPNVYYFDTKNDFEIEIQKLKKWLLNKKITLDYFFNDSEYYIEDSNKIAKSLGLESLSIEQIKWVRDKVDMKDKFNEIGLSTVKYAAIESKKDIVDFFIENNCKPIIFKPRRGMNSINVYKIESLSDIDNLNIELKPNKFMVEEFCYDHEWSIESLVQNGKVLDSYVTYIPNATIWASISNNLNCHMTVPKIPSFFKFVPKDFIQQIVSGMNLKNGAMTIEVFISDDGNIKASELGWRLPGCQATLNHSYSYGIDIYDLLIDIAIHKPVNLRYRDKIISVGDLYLPNKEGIVEKITPLEELLKMNGVIGGEMFAKVGEYQKKRRVGNDASGWVQVVGENEVETLKNMELIFDMFVIETDKDIKERSGVYVKKK